jgi:hypothetical protein
MVESLWTVEPALFVELIAPTLPASADVVLVKKPVRQVQIVDEKLAVLLRARPKGKRWVISAWVAEAGLDNVTTRLALEVSASNPNEVILESTMGLADVLAAHSSTELKPAALWSYMRRLMEQARLAFDSADLRAKIPMLTVDTAFIVPAKVELAGMWEGYPFDFRVQYGSASLKISADRNTLEPLWFAGMYFDKWDTLSEDQLPSWTQIRSLFATLASRVERAPFIYLFRRVSPSDDEAPWESSGQSSQDAYHNLLARVSRLSDQGYLSGGEFGIFDPTPLNVDERRFPAETPKFEVLS